MSHYVYQAVPHSKLKLKEQNPIWRKYNLKVTPLAQDTCAEALLSDRFMCFPSYKTSSDNMELCFQVQNFKDTWFYYLF